jgi:streptogramin lyase
VRLTGLAIVTALALSACGGGGTNTEPAGTSAVLPPSNTHSTAVVQQGALTTLSSSAGSGPQIQAKNYNVSGYPADGTVAIATDGSVWFGSQPSGSNRVLVRMQGSNVTIVPFSQSNVAAGWMTATSNGRVWYDSQFFASNFYYASAGSKSAALGSTEPNNPAAGWQSSIPKVGPNGNVWFALYGPPLEFEGCQGLCPPEEAGSVNQNASGGPPSTFFQPPQRPNGDNTVITAVTTGPDGNIWLGGYALPNVPGGNGGGIDRYTTSGVLLGALITNADYISDMVTGPDGNVWLADPAGNQIVRVTPSGVSTQFPLPVPNAEPEEIVVGGDGALWFTEDNTNQVGRITTSGQISEYTLPSPATNPVQIVGPQTSSGCGASALWVSDQNGSITELII